MGQNKELDQGTATGDIVAGDPPSDLASCVPALILPTSDGPDPPSDLASSVPALSLPTPDGPALCNPTPDGSPHSPDDHFLPPPGGSPHSPDDHFLPPPGGSPHSPDDHFLPPPGRLESPDPSLQIVAASASPISVLAASESSSDVVVPATLQSQPDPVFSAPLSSPAQLHCDVDPVSALVHFCSTPSPDPSLSPAPTLDAMASQESVFAETVERLSAVAQQKGLAFDVFHSLLVCPRRMCSHTTNFLLSFIFQTGSFQSHYSAKGFTWIHTQTWG